MPIDYRDHLVDMITAATLDETVTLALRALRSLVPLQAAALLLWDVELDRYIIGDISILDSTHSPADFRRWVLQSAIAAHQQQSDNGRCLTDSLYYEPLNTPDKRHIGAFLYLADGQTTTQTGYEQLIRATTRALWTMTRIEQADREHAQLIKERERLEDLLRAVDQQQQIIDRLLTIERQFSASLEAEVAERTAALKDAQARILQSEKLAVIGQLAGSLAHEINNPLQAIQSGLELAIAELQGGQAANVLDDLQVIQSELERIQSIFKQMLDFQRPVARVRQPLDINAICEGVRVLMRKRLQEAYITLTLNLADRLPTTCGDSNQMKQVLLNLILNAADAMPASGGEIMLQTRHTSDYVQIIVNDNGGGIAPEHQQQLFEPFFTTKTRGLGLGLAISREIIDQHNGKIDVQTAENIGATFTISLVIEEVCDETQSPYSDC